MVFQSFFEAIFKSIFLYQIKSAKQKIVSRLRHQIVIGGGIEINRPKTPDVLTNIMAKFSSIRCFICGFFNFIFFEVFLMLF